MSRIGSKTIGLAAFAASAMLALAMPAAAQNAGDVGRGSDGNVYTYIVDRNGNGTWHKGRVAAGPERTIIAEQFIPAIWVDPDGCEHWVMDDGFEGFMSPHLDRHGRPVCGRAGR